LDWIATNILDAASAAPPKAPKAHATRHQVPVFPKAPAVPYVLPSARKDQTVMKVEDKHFEDMTSLGFKYSAAENAVMADLIQADAAKKKTSVINAMKTTRKAAPLQEIGNTRNSKRKAASDATGVKSITRIAAKRKMSEIESAKSHRESQQRYRDRQKAERENDPKAKDTWKLEASEKNAFDVSKLTATQRETRRLRNLKNRKKATLHQTPNEFRNDLIADTFGPEDDFNGGAFAAGLHQGIVNG
jgi:hypothetical protein